MSQTIVLNQRFLRGTIANSRLPSSISVGSFSGDGAGLYNLNASKITTGTLDNARLPANISTTTFSGDGASLSNLNASFITSGTLSNAHLPSTIFASFVGIGTTFPQKELHVIGDAFVSGTLMSSNLAVIGDTVTLNTTTSNTERMTVTNAGTGPALEVVQTGTQPIARFYDDANVALIITDGGNVGVNTSLPQEKLHIVGNTKVVGDVSAQNLIGNGASLSNLNASSVASGTLAQERLPSSGVTAGAYGAATSIPILAIDTYGRVTSAHTSNFVASQWANGDHGVISYTNGNVGIGTSSPIFKLQVQGSMYATELDTTVVFTSAVGETSDERHKKDIHVIEAPLSKVNALRGVTFKWQSDERLDMGMIAQEVETVIPEVVSERSDGTKTIAYTHLVGLLVEAVKEQQKTIEVLKEDVRQLKEAISG